jgi:hypothetical protein
MSVLAVLRGGQLSATPMWSRHATPRKFTHVIANGVKGAGIYRAIDEAATGVYVLGHPTLGQPPPMTLHPDGVSLMHVYNWIQVPLSMTQAEIEALTPEELSALGRPVISAEQFAISQNVELFVGGWITKLLNGETIRYDDGDGQIIRRKFCALELDDATFLDAISPQFIDWRSDTQAPSEIPDWYRSSPGGPLRYRQSDMIETVVFTWSDGTGAPPL